MRRGKSRGMGLLRLKMGMFIMDSFRRIILMGQAFISIPMGESILGTGKMGRKKDLAISAGPTGGFMRESILMIRRTGTASCSGPTGSGMRVIGIMACSTARGSW